MLRYLKEKIKTEFFIAFGTTSIATILQVCIGIIVNKIIAIKVGPPGMAVLSQFIDFKNLVTNVSVFGSSQGVTKYVSDPNYNTKKLLSTVTSFILILSLLLSVFLFVFSSFVSQWILGSRDYYFVIMFFAVTLVFFALNTTLVASINGFRNYKLLAKVKIINSLVGLLLSGILTWFFFLEGALIAIAINTSIVFFATLFLLGKNKTKFFYLNFKLFSSSLFKKILGFSIMALVGLILKPTVQIYIRDYITVNSSSFNAGLWDSMKKMSEYYTQIITVSLGVYYLPKLSSLKSNFDLKEEMVSGIKKVSLIFSIMAVVIFGFKDLLIQLLFSGDFMLMRDLFFPQLSGDLLMLISFMIAYLMLAKEMIKEFVLLQIIMSITRVIFSVLLFDIEGIKGVIWANMINYLLYIILLSFFLRNVLFSKDTV